MYSIAEHQELEDLNRDNEALDNPEKQKEQIMEIYEEGTSILETALDSNREAISRRRPRGTVVVALWDEGEGVTQKMFANSFESLRIQAEDAQLDLDFIIVANNGGGESEEAGNKLLKDIRNTLQSYNDDVVLCETSRPGGEEQVLDAGDPWELDLDFADTPEREGTNRFRVVKQQRDTLNKGKIRAIRDATNALGHEIIDKGYCPDFILQMDAETLLFMENQKLEEEGINPLKVMHNHLTRRNLTAVGTKDKFTIINEETGEPTDKPVGSAQLGYELSNGPDQFVTLPGGALMSKPANYIAGMTAISRVTPSMGVEDYMYTRILEEVAHNTGKDPSEIMESLGNVRHLNRTPEYWFAAIMQLANWRNHARAVDRIFPGNEYEMETLMVNARNVLTSRIKTALEKGPKHLGKILRDLADVPTVIKELYSDEIPDVSNSNGGVTWTNTKLKSSPK